MIFDELPEFRREFRKFAKKYKSLSDDFEDFRSVVTAAPLGNGRKRFSALFQSEHVCVIKARFSCRYLKRSSLRIVYAYSGRGERVDFIELYFKGDKENENGERIKEYLKKRHGLSSGIV